jgi:succinate dehydrogenase (ubiquinone) cytochrome b560 subunit
MDDKAKPFSFSPVTLTPPSSSSSIIFKSSSSSRQASPLAIATATSYTTTRRAATSSSSSSSSTTTEKEANSILASQRRNRPVSPHISIYQPQITWYASGLNRITGVTLAGTFYVFGAAYLVAPLLGWHLESASVAAAFASLPVVAKMGVKAFFALPFTFHSLNGIRHLVWDAGLAFSNQQVIRTGWTVVGLSVVSALGLTFLL